LEQDTYELMRCVLLCMLDAVEVCSVCWRMLEVLEVMCYVLLLLDAAEV